MGSSNPRYLAAWPKEQQATGGGGGTGTVTSVGSGSGLLGGPITGAGALSVDYGTSADLLAGTNPVKLYTAAALAGASVAGISAGAGDAGKFLRLDANGFLSPSVMGANAIAATVGVVDAGKLVKTDATGKIDPSFLPPSGGTGTVTNIATGSGILGGPINTTGTISLDYGTSAELLTGTDTSKVYHAAAIAGASTVASAGAADSGKLVKLDATGKLSNTFLDGATSAEVLAGTAGSGVVTPDTLLSASVAGTSAGAADANKYVRLDTSGLLSPAVFGNRATAASAGAADAGDFLLLNAAGKVDNTALDLATAAEVQAGTGATNIVEAGVLSAASVKVFGSAADDGKYVRVTTSGKVDMSLLPLSSALVYRGNEQPTSAAPATAAVGDVYILDAAGTFDPSWGALAGATGAVGDQLIYDGTKWNLVGATSAGGTVTNIASGSGLLGGPITSTGTLSLDYGTSADLIAGTDTVKVYNAATLAGASVAASAGAADAGKFIKTDAAGKIDVSLMPTSGVAAGTYRSVTVDAYGHVTAGTNPTTLAGYGITDAVPASASVSGGTSLTGGGALSGSPLTITLVNDSAAPGNSYYYGTDASGVKGYHILPAGGGGGAGTVTSIATGAGLTGGPITGTGTIALDTSGVTAGTSGSGTQIPVVTVDTYGRITSITTATNAPDWANITSKPTTIAGYGITDAVVSTRQITGITSLTGGGDLTADRTISLVGDAAAPGNSFYYGTDAGGAKGFFALPTSSGSGTVTSVTAGAGLTGGTISTTGTIALAASGAAAGTYTSVTVDTYGRVTAGANPTTLAGYGITDGVVSTRTVTGATSLTGGGDLTANRTISLVNDSAAPGNDFFYGTTSAGVKGWRDLSGLGYVVGPASATDNAVARYDAATGKLIQNSGVIIDDSNNVSGVVNLTTSGNTTLGDAAADTYTLNGSTMAVPNGLNIDGNTLMIDAANNRVGFGTATPASQADVNGTAVNNTVAVAASAMDLALGQVFTKTAAGSLIWSFANVPASRAITVVLHLTNGGSGVQTWPASVKWPGGTGPILTNPGVDVLVFNTPDGGTTWRGNIFGKDIK